MVRSFALFAAALALPAAGSAQTLVSSSPAAGATIARTTTLTLVFDTPVEAKSVSAALTMTAMAGMPAGHRMRMTAIRTKLAKDRKTVTITATKPFPAGSYELAWRAGAAAGTLRFSIG